MATLLHLTDTFGFPIHINTEPNLSSKSNCTPIPCYSGVDVSFISCKVYKLFCCSGSKKYFPDENIPLSLNSFCVTGS